MRTMYLSLVYSNSSVVHRRIDISPVRGYERSGRAGYRQKTWSVLVFNGGAELYLRPVAYITACTTVQAMMHTS